MIKEVDEIQSSELCAGSTEQTGCKAFTKLKDWQVDQYRMAVDENKWYMGERLGRYVEWEEAEDDFLHNGYYGCAPKWRKEYCAQKCTHFATCGLGREFCKPKKQPANHLAGTSNK